MHHTDLRILRAMGALPFINGPRSADVLKPGTIAGRIGLRADLVRNRIHALETAGIITGYEVFPNQRHLNFRQVTFHYKIDAAHRENLLDALHDVDGIQAIFHYLEGEVCIDLVHQTEIDLDRKLRAITKATGCDVHHRIYEAAMPPVSAHLSLLDWRIIESLRGNARRPLADVAKALGVTNKTVRRHFSRMMEEGSIDILPLVDPSRIEGRVMFELVCYLSGVDRPTTVNQILHTIDDCYLSYIEPPSEELGDLRFFASARSPRDMDDMRRQLLAIPGVTRTEALIPSHANYLHAWADEAIAARIEALGGPMSQTPGPRRQKGHSKPQAVHTPGTARRRLH